MDLGLGGGVGLNWAWERTGLGLTGLEWDGMGWLVEDAFLCLLLTRDEDGS